MNLSAIPTSSPIGRTLRALLRVVPPDLVVPVVQGPLRGSRWVVGSSNHGCWLGSYEWVKQRAFSAAIRPGDMVVDVGAHVGFYTLIAARRVGRYGGVYAFEPYPRNIEFLKRHIALNRLDNVHLEPFAVWSSDEILRFSDVEGHSQGHVAESGGLRVQAVRLDSYLKRWGDRLPSAIKVDVEGGELEVLQGARELLERAAPALFVESWGSALQSCVAFLEPLGYTVEPLFRGTPLLESNEFVARR